MMFVCGSHKVEDGGFNGTLPISINNERATLIALRDTVHSLGSWYPTSVEEDEALLALTSLGPKVSCATLCHVITHHQSSRSHAAEGERGSSPAYIAYAPPSTPLLKEPTAAPKRFRAVLLDCAVGCRREE